MTTQPPSDGLLHPRSTNRFLQATKFDWGYLVVILLSLPVLWPLGAVYTDAIKSTHTVALIFSGLAISLFCGKHSDLCMGIT